MTIIAYKDGILAGDSLCSYDGIHFFNSIKLYIDAGFIYGFAGDCISIGNFIKSLNNKEKFECLEKEGINAIKIDLKTKKVYIIQAKHGGVCETEIVDKFIAIGLGDQPAKGAMEMGASAIKACEIACKYSICRPPIYYIDINKSKIEIKKWSD